MTPSNTSYREIPLTKGQVAIVDADWFPILAQWKWQARWSEGMQSFYAFRDVRYGPRSEGRKRATYMHRQILGLALGDKKHGDHINGNTLDNRQENLRITDHFGNARNRKTRKDSKSKIKGVWFQKSHKKWTAQISVNHRKIFLGLHNTPEEAREAYRKAAKHYYGEFARFD